MESSTIIIYRENVELETTTLFLEELEGKSNSGSGIVLSTKLN